MSKNNRIPESDTLTSLLQKQFRGPPNDELLTEIRALSAKVDALHAALVKPQSIIILAGNDIARIAAEIARTNPQGAASGRPATQRGVTP